MGKKRKSTEYFSVDLSAKKPAVDSRITEEVVTRLKELVRRYGTIEDLCKLRDQTFVDKTYESIAHGFGDRPSCHVKRKRLRAHLIKQHRSQHPLADTFWARVRIGFNSTMRTVERMQADSGPQLRVVLVEAAEAEHCAVQLLQNVAAGLRCPVVAVPELGEVWRCSRRGVSVVTAAAITTGAALPELEHVCDLVASKVAPPSVATTLANSELRERGRHLLGRDPSLTALPERPRADVDAAVTFVPPRLVDVPVSDKGSRREKQREKMRQKLKLKRLKKAARKKAK